MNRKAVIFSDLHIHNYKQFNNQYGRLENCLNVLNDLGNFCTKHNIQIVLFAGDFFDTQKALLTEVVNDTVDAMLKFSKDFPDIIIYAISGNHDHATKNLIDKPAVTAAHYIAQICPNFILLDNLSVGLGDGLIISGIPYYEYPEHFSQALDYVEGAQTDKHYLMIHQTPKGLDNDMIAYDCNPADERFKGFAHVFCGHIHKRQQLMDNFTIVGSPIHRDLGDVGQEKGFLVMNLDKPEKGAVFIPLPSYPIFLELYEDEITQEDLDSGDFIVKKPRLQDIKLSETANVENFSTSLSSQDIMTNYWKEVDGKDKKLLQVGLSFLNP